MPKSVSYRGRIQDSLPLQEGVQSSFNCTGGTGLTHISRQVFIEGYVTPLLLSQEGISGSQEVPGSIFSGDYWAELFCYPM